MGPRAGRAAGLLLLLLAVGAPLSGQAFEFLDGKLQVHGFFEEQIRGLSRDFDPTDDLDLAQWYHVLNLEVEWEAAPAGWGPLDLVSFFSRLEARYDCVWTRGCGLFPSVNAFGDRAEHLPKRVIDQRRSGFTGQLQLGDRRGYAGVGQVEADYGFLNVPRGDTRAPLQFFQTPGFSILFGIAGPDGVVETGDDPSPFVYDEILRNCVFNARKLKGFDGGLDPFRSQGPWNPGCKVQPIGRLRGKPNPLNPFDENPVLFGPDQIKGTADDASANVFGVLGGSNELPFRPAPLFLAADGTPRPDLVATGVLDPAARAAPHDAQGIFLPNPELARLIRQGDLGSFDQNFRQAELEWNRGASQQDEKELKELYVDLEMFDSRLWIRGGKQSIVWGKTELFRTTDQFNPQDLALASLPSLEESRIALWALRGVWSFYSVGPLEDLRLEMAFNYDQFEPADLGRCGEPFSPNPVCDKTFGLFAYGLTGVGLAGEVRPPDPWNDFKGIEAGARLEWRWGRFSFQLSDFYGYNDFPFADKIFDFERNVDPESGRPRRLNLRGACVTGAEPACLGVALNPASPAGNPFTDLDGDGNPDRFGDLDCDGVAPDDPRCNPDADPGSIAIPHEQRLDLLANASVNQWLFAMVCATSFGASDVAPESCGQNVFNSQSDQGFFTLAQLFSAVLAGSPSARTALALPSGLIPGITLPLIQLNRDPGDATPGSDFGPPARKNPVDPSFSQFAALDETLGQRLTPQQEALLGCGPHWGTHCDDDGIDLGLVETSAIMQSWPGFEGTFGDWVVDGRPQAGTQDFVLSGTAGSPCTRFEDGQLFILPGCRGPDYNEDVLRTLYGIPNASGAYDPLVDGCARDDGSPECAGAATLAIPGTVIDGTNTLGPAVGQPFASEMSALSWNFLQALVSFSSPRDFAVTPTPDDPLLSEFDIDDPFGLGRPDNACSFRRPQFCFAVIGLFNLSGVQRNSLRAAGNERFGRRDFQWHSGGTAVLRYERRNVLGFALDFAEDRSKSNWSLEATWIEGLQFLDVNQEDQRTTADTFNLTLSADRPTFINFLNPNRTFLFNTQWFFQYVDGYQRGFITTGPFNMLATFTVFTGYSQDRLLTFVTGVYDFESNSGGFLPQVIYRFTENFSATVGLNLFFGGWDERPTELRPIGTHRNRVGGDAYKSFWENGLSAVRDRDEIFLRVRYSF